MFMNKCLVKHASSINVSGYWVGEVWAWCGGLGGLGVVAKSGSMGAKLIDFVKFVGYFLGFDGLLVGLNG